MKSLFFIILLNLNLFGVEKSQALLDSISEYAIRLGDGNISTEYIFVDPLCRHSKSYMKIIFEDENLQEENSYYIFLYRLPKYDSGSLIEYIYQSKERLYALKEIMVDDKEIDESYLFDLEVSEETLSIIKKIARVGKKLKAKRRPYIVKIYKK